MRLVDWQMNWRHWHFGKESYCISQWGYNFDEIFIFIGPLQLRFWK